MTRHSANRNTTFTSPVFVCATLCCAANTSNATVDFVPHADANYEYASNIFLLPDGTSAQLGTDGTPSFSDRHWAYSGGINATGTWGETKLDIATDVRRYSYEQFSQLDHNDQTVSAALTWVATSRLTGNTKLNYEQHFTPFTESNPNELLNNQNKELSAITFNQINRKFSTQAAYQISNKWQTSAEVGLVHITYPNPAGTATNGYTYSVTQISKGLNVKYGGAGRLKVGVGLLMDDGSYSKNVLTPSYSLQTVQLTLDYAVGKSSSLNASLGHSQYDQTDIKSHATTGGVNFTQALTPKTNYNLRYDRSYSAYPITGTSQLTETTSGGASWQALKKVSLSASYSISKASADAGLLGAGQFSDAHTDKLYSSNYTLVYSMQTWLTFSPYYVKQRRTSDTNRYDFANDTYGINISVLIP